MKFVLYLFIFLGCNKLERTPKGAESELKSILGRSVKCKELDGSHSHSPILCYASMNEVWYCPPPVDRDCFFAKSIIYNEDVEKPLVDAGVAD